jgi:Gram-negative bacterial TonB protein C-terminal
MPRQKGGASVEEHSMSPRRRLVLRIAAMLLGTICTVAWLRDAEPSQEPLPTVTNAAVPLYPRTADLAHIEGIVRLQVSTDGARVSNVKVESGPPMLAKAAADNVRTWEFSQHKPTTFKVKFNYRILPESGCYVDNSVVMLRLPTEVEVSTKGVHTCDPTGTVN